MKSCFRKAGEASKSAGLFMTKTQMFLPLLSDELNADFTPLPKQSPFQGQQTLDDS